MANPHCNRTIPNSTGVEALDGTDGRIHKVLLSYRGYTNIYFCPDCGKRFNTELKEDEGY